MAKSEKAMFGRLDSLIRNEIFHGLVFVAITATVSQLIFSPLGFNPTDDGFILAGSRRILDGEIPHRDFISIRTTGSLYLHAPFIVVFGDHCLWYSRYFYWVEMATIAWMWTLLISRSVFKIDRGWLRFGLGMLAFCFSSHVFPPMAWHTVDAILFSSVGVCLAAQKKVSWKMIGYLSIGASVLFRQNFIVFLPIAVIALGDMRRIRYWVLAFVPIVGYVFFVALNHALPDFIAQMTTYGAGTSAWAGIGAYVVNGGLGWGALIGFLSMMMLLGEFKLFSILREEKRTKLIAEAVLLGVPVLIVAAMAYAGFSGVYLSYASFGVFGICLGVTLSCVKSDRALSPRVRIGVLALAISWVASLSVGYNTPALGSGSLVIYIIASVLSVVKSGREHEATEARDATTHSHRAAVERGSPLKTVTTLLIVLLLVSTPVLFGVARLTHIYRECPATKLSYEIGDVLKGGWNVRTDRNTYMFLWDLRNAAEQVAAEGKEYVILPDCAAFWIRSPQKNPLSCDWPQDTELGSQELIERIEADLQSHRGSIIVLVQKYEAYALASGFKPLGDTYGIVEYVRSSFDLTAETTFFMMYE